MYNIFSFYLWQSQSVLIKFSKYLLLLFSHSDMSDSLWPMDRSMPGFPVLNYLLDLAQTHVHWVSDAIESSCPLSSPSPTAFNLSQHQVFSNEPSFHIRWPNYWSFSFNISPSNKYPGLISFRVDWLISLQSKRLSTVYSNTTVQKVQLFSVQPSL